jgi:hypothetical protein
VIGLERVYSLEKKLIKKQSVTEQDFANLSPKENMQLALLLTEKLNVAYMNMKTY